MTNNSTGFVYHYHQRTKHQLNAYAKGPEFLDWEQQPNPFRIFSGCPKINLPSPGKDLPTLFADLDSLDAIPSRPLDLTNLGLMLELAFGLSAWKQHGPDRWALRCNPSSGNLHPTEAYLICTDSQLLKPGVYHYVSHDHLLERRSEIDTNKQLLTEEVYIGLSSIHWREAWKYGERAFRYCQHDIGHALAGLSYAAAVLGWSVELCSEAADVDIASWLGLDREQDFVKTEQEHPDLICRLRIGKPLSKAIDNMALSQTLQSSQWCGKAEALCDRHFFRWPVIEEVAKHTQKSITATDRWQASTRELPLPRNNIRTSQLIRQRRSAQQFNGKASPLALSDFQRILLTLLPNTKPPFTAWNWSPQIHLVLFVHRVEGLEPGLYFLPRDPQVVTELQNIFPAEFNWQAIAGPCELYQLNQADIRQASKTLSCHQSIASDSAFSLAMLARFSDNIDQAPWHYRRLFWECGLLGQILYLEAEAAGIRGTGIGCFFDDQVHGVLGLTNTKWQTLYHFTLGEPIIDNRLQTLPAYAHLLR